MQDAYCYKLALGNFNCRQLYTSYSSLIQLTLKRTGFKCLLFVLQISYKLYYLKNEIQLLFSE